MGVVLRKIGSTLLIFGLLLTAYGAYRATETTCDPSYTSVFGKQCVGWGDLLAFCDKNAPSNPALKTVCDDARREYNGYLMMLGLGVVLLIVGIILFIKGRAAPLVPPQPPPFEIGPYQQYQPQYPPPPSGP